tara:strand:- start:180 stop:575 length:396 start_codon:yes stop_codon:yes gene_type:complete
MRTQLLCTFTKKKKIDDTIDAILDIYTVVFDKIFILEGDSNEDEYILTYNVEAGERINRLPNTISLHRKKQTNTLYTINALNNLVQLLNDGEIDPTFPIEWENYRNMLLVTNDSGYELKKIKTKVDKIVKL